MPFAEHFIVQGLTTASQTATLPASININCGFLPTKVEVVNTTQFGQTGTGNLNIQSMVWNAGVPTPTYIQYINAAGTALLPAAVTSNAISLYDGQQSVLLGPAITGTTITQASPAVATAAAHGLQTGDIVQITNNVTMKQLGGLYFTITVTGANTFTIPIDASGFSNAESAFVVRKVKVGPLFYPQAITISAISKAASAVVSTTFAHGLTVGQKVRLRVPVPYGMIQANNLQGVITVVNSATQFTIGGLDSSAFTTFVYPVQGGASWAAAGPAQVVPVGSGPSAVTTPPYWYEDTLADAETNTQYQGFTIGTGLLKTSTNAVVGITASDILLWTAYRGDV